jgi:plasmid stability protein
MRVPAKAEKYMLRLPGDLRSTLKERAAANGRSMNSEIVAAIQRHLATDGLLAELSDRISRLEREILTGKGSPK